VTTRSPQYDKPSADEQSRAHASFVVAGRRLALLQAAADARCQRLGNAARDLALLWLESQPLVASTELRQLRADVDALQAAAPGKPADAGN
jgi:hypothetical protein